MARPRGIRKAQADAVLLLAYLGSLYTAQPHPNPLFPLQLQHNSYPSKTLLPTGLVSNLAFLKQFSRCNAFKYPNNLTRCNLRMCRTKYMYVIFVATYLLKLNVVSLFYLFRSHHNDFYNRFV